MNSESTAYNSLSVDDSVKFGEMKNWASLSNASSKASLEQSKWKLVFVSDVYALFVPPFFYINSSYSFSSGYFAVP